MITDIVSIHLVDDTDRIRPVEPAWVEVMAADMAQGIHLPPILIRPALHPEVREGCEYALVSGGHRIAAARLAGHVQIRADIEEMTRAEARIREVDENLKRNNLHALDRALFLQARKAAHEELHPETQQGGDRKSRKRRDDFKSQTLRLDLPARFTAEAAAKIGLSERTVQDAIALADALDPQALPSLRQTDLVDNGAALKLLASYPPQEQFQIAVALANGDARDIRSARVSVGLDAPSTPDAQEVIFNKLVELYGRANARTKRRFEEHAELVLGNQSRVA